MKRIAQKVDSIEVKKRPDEVEPEPI